MRTVTRMIQRQGSNAPRPPGKKPEAMNIAITERNPAAAQSLKDKVSLITGSTSGIGLASPGPLPAAGSAVVLNGFGKPEEIEAARTARHGARRARSPIRAPTCEAGNDRRDDREDAATIRPGRHPGQQRRHPARRAACTSFRRQSGTRSSPSISARRSTPRGSPCPP